MNKKNLERKTVALGVPQLVAILGLFIGCVAAAFCLGFVSGRSRGFENELANMVAGLPKMPVTADGLGSEPGDEIVSEVYAKLNEQERAAEIHDTLPSPEAGLIPELASIKEAEKSPENIDITGEDPEIAEIDAAADSILNRQIADSLLENKKDRGDATIGANAGIKILGEERGLPDSQSTGNNLANLKEQAKKTESVTESTRVKPVETAKPVETRTEVKPVLTIPEQSEAVPPMPLSASNFIRKKIPGGWFAQIAAPKKIEDANQLARSLRDSGFPVMIESAQVRGEEYFRVLVGPEASKEQADILLKQIKREPYIKSDPFIRLVK